MSDDKRLDKHSRYRLAHPETVAAAKASWYARNREVVLTQKRARYLANRDIILENLRSEKAQCPHCNLMYTARYLPKHVESRCRALRCTT